MRIAATDLETEATYKLITGLVVPRPIAWVTTLSRSGSVNLAPFSFFTCVAPKPPLLAISVGRSGGVYKDTARNILALEEYVIHIADFSHLEALHLSAAAYPPMSARRRRPGSPPCRATRSLCRDCATRRSRWNAGYATALNSATPGTG
jgi:flavin reductase (DIM6/NTAB) family NADH-FMN oxidoreductase RutF